MTFYRKYEGKRRATVIRITYKYLPNMIRYGESPCICFWSRELSNTLGKRDSIGFIVCRNITTLFSVKNLTQEYQML